MKKMICYCGHDCARCVTYRATVEQNESLREQAQRFYRESFALEVPLSELCCQGGRGESVMSLCRECPWKLCCERQGIEACDQCKQYPCRQLAAYMEKYVNKCNQLNEEGDNIR